MKITRVMKKYIEYERIVLEYTKRSFLGKIQTYQAYGSSGGVVWRDYNSGARLSLDTELYFSDVSGMADRLLKQYCISLNNWLDLDNNTMTSLLKNDINDADVFKVVKV